MTEIKDVTTPKVSTLEEIREQTKAVIIEIPGYAGGTVIGVKVQPVDLSSIMLEHNLSNPLVDKVQAKAKKGQLNQKQVQAELEKQLSNEAERNKRLKEMEPTFDVLCQAAMVEPTFDQLQEIRPMTMMQKVAIFNWASSGAVQLNSFRR